MAVADRVPPVRRSDKDECAATPRAGIAADAVFDQAVAVVVFGEHFIGPLLDADVVLLQPGIVVAAADVIAGRDQEGGIGVQRRLGIILIRRQIVSVIRHAIGLAARQNPVEGLANHVEGSEAVGQRGRVPGDVGVFVVAQGAGIADGVVRQGAEAGTQLEDVQPVAAEAVEPRVLVKFQHPRRDRDDFPPILDAGPLRVGRRKEHANELAPGPLGVVTQDGVFEIGRGDSDRALVGQMENRRQAHAPLRAELSQERRPAELGVELEDDRLGRIGFRPARNQRKALVVEIDRPPGRRRRIDALSAILHAGGGASRDDRQRHGGGRGGLLQRTGSEFAPSETIERKIQELRLLQRERRIQIPVGDVVSGTERNRRHPIAGGLRLRLRGKRRRNEHRRCNNRHRNAITNTGMNCATPRRTDFRIRLDFSDGFGNPSYRPNRLALARCFAHHRFPSFVGLKS